MIEIVLTNEEINNAFKQAKFSRTEAIANSRKPTYGQSTEPTKVWLQVIEGCYYEAAVCKFQGIPYKHRLFGIDTGKYEVRGTKYPYGKLILHPKDRGDLVFILVTGVCPKFLLRGWIYGHEGQLEKYWADPSGKNRFAYFVPQKMLHDMAELPL